VRVGLVGDPQDGAGARRGRVEEEDAEQEGVEVGVAGAPARAAGPRDARTSPWPSQSRCAGSGSSLRSSGSRGGRARAASSARARSS